MQENLNMPLQGIKVIELATVVAAPTAGRMLCAYGAEVVKVESAIGDDMRHAGEFEGVICEDDVNPLFTIQNSGKALTSINLKDPAGKEAFMRLLASADVFLTNVRAQSLARLGLGYDEIKEKLPGLIYAHFSGFGPAGPDAARPGFDSTAFWLRTGPLADWQAPGYFPFTPTYAFGDMATSSVLLSGILMALIGRQRTKKGTLVNTSLFASGIWCNAIGVVSHQPPFKGERSNDPLRPADPFCHFYKCADGKWIGVFDNEYTRELPKFAELFNMPELLGDPDCATLERLRDSDAVAGVTEKLNAMFIEKTSAEWIEFFERNNVSCELMRAAREVSRDAQAIANGYVETVDFGGGTEVAMPCPPVHFSDYDTRPYTPAGRLGKDTDAVFSGLGYSPEETEKMRSDGAIK